MLERDSKIFEQRAVLSIITESMVGLITSILLYCGARRKNKYMLVPFMLVMVLLQAFLVITLFLFATLCISGECINGDPLIYFYLALLFILISITIIDLYVEDVRNFMNEGSLIFILTQILSYSGHGRISNHISC